MFEEPTTTTTLIRFARPEAERPTYTSGTSPEASPAQRSSTTRTYTNSTEPSRISKRRQRTRTFAADPFRARFGQRLPQGMRQEARNMDWKTFTTRFAPSDIRVENMRMIRQRAGRFDFDVTISGLSAPNTATRAELRAMGTSSAITEILADHGLPVEVLEFHQFTIFEATATFLYCVDGSKRCWAVGFGSDSDLSIADALCSAATNLHLR